MGFFSGAGAAAIASKRMGRAAGRMGRAKKVRAGKGVRSNGDLKFRKKKVVRPMARGRMAMRRGRGGSSMGGLGGRRPVNMRASMQI